MIKYIAKLTSDGTNNPTVEVYETLNIAPDAITWEYEAEGIFVGATNEDYFDSNQPEMWTLADYDGKSYSIIARDGAHIEVRGKLPNGDDSTAVFAGIGRLIEIIVY